MTGLGRGFVGVFVLAVTVLVALRLIYGRQSLRDSVGLLLHTLAWVAIFGTLFGGFVMLFGWLGILLFLACFGVAILVFAQTRAVFQRTLLRLLALGVEKQMPLPQLVWAFASETPGYLSRRAERMAGQLSWGVSLPEALVSSRGLLPRYTYVATQVGLCVGNLGRALQEAAMALALRRPLWHAAAGRIYYLGWFVTTLPVVLLFLLFRIQPAMDAISQDFGGPVVFDEATQSILHGILVTVLMLSWIASVLLIPYFTLHYLGFIRFGLPGLNRILRPFESSIVLRFLALGTERGVPLSQLFDVMSVAYPLPSMRSRIDDVSRDVAAGADWTGSLRRRGIVNGRAAAVLSAAQRLGNISWALREVADHGERRLAQRLEAWSRALFIGTILIAGAVVAYIVVMFFIPLVNIISWTAIS